MEFTLSWHKRRDKGAVTPARGGWPPSPDSKVVVFSWEITSLSKLLAPVGGNIVPPLDLHDIDYCAITVF